MGNLKALEGCFWVCNHCGKKSPQKYPGGPGADRGYDESCMMNSVHAQWNEARDCWVHVPHPDDTSRHHRKELLEADDKTPLS